MALASSPKVRPAWPTARPARIVARPGWARRHKARSALRRQRLTGPAIARQLGMPVATVGCVLRRLGLGKLGALEPRPPIVRYQRERPGELIHIDTKKLGRIAASATASPATAADSRRGAGWEVLHVCIDDASRLAYSEILPDERKTSAVPSSSARSPGSRARASPSSGS